MSWRPPGDDDEEGGEGEDGMEAEVFGDAAEGETVRIEREMKVERERG